jgi:hypothetical protein
MFLDGPAAGRSLDLRRAPFLLRVVVDRATGAVDALDQLVDEPGDGEDVHVYVLAAPPQRAHVCYRGSKKRQSGWWEFGIYRHLADVDGEELRETDTWRAWARDRHAAAIAAASE